MSGPYIGIINLKDRRRSVLVIPEITFNSGWMLIAAKVERFIIFHKNEKVPVEPRLTDKNIPYAHAVRSSKWSNSGGKFVQCRRYIGESCNTSYGFHEFLRF